MPQNPVAIIFFSHVFDAASLARLAKLREESASHGTFFVYADARYPLPAAAQAPVETFDFDAIRRMRTGTLGEDVIPGNGHLTLLEFSKRYPQFDYYWVIEYDVAFTADWGDFFGAFEERDEDFLAAHLRTYEEEPTWFWWGSLRPPDGSAQPAQLIRAFCPVQRVSRRALELLERRVAEGWSGHFECLVPTLISARGYSLADIGGDGRWVPPGFRNRFYRSFSWPDGCLPLGSMRYRPPLSSLRFSRPGTLYHPLKSAWSIAERLSQIRYLARNFVRHPIDFIGALARLQRH